MRTLEGNVIFTEGILIQYIVVNMNVLQLSLKSLSLSPVQICKQDRHGLIRFLDFC